MRSKSKNKNKKKSASKAAIGKAVIIIAALCAAVFGIRAAVSFVRNADYFTVTDISYPESFSFLESSAVMSLKGASIFDVDLQKVCQKLKARYPQCAHLRIARHFPNEIAITATQRLGFVQLLAAHTVAVLDKDGIIMSITNTVGDELPLVTGVPVAASQLRTGVRIANAQLQAAIRLIAAFQGERALAPYRVFKIDAAQVSAIEIYLHNNLKVIVNDDNAVRKMQMLGLVLSQIESDQARIAYIDLRFKEPVVGTR